MPEDPRSSVSDEAEEVEEAEAAEVPVAPPQEPETTTGKLAEDVAGREETTEGPPDDHELYVEISEGTTSVPED